MFSKKESEKINWHYSRNELAKKYYDSLSLGQSNCIALFGMRRIGKTQFLVKDLLPYADRRGAKTIYCSLWGNAEHPALALIGALEQILDKGKNGKVTGKLSFAAEAAPGLEASFGLEFTSENKPRSASLDEIRHLNTLFQRLAAYEPKKEKILVVDEVQTLGENQEFYGLSAALRTFLDTAPDKVKTIFTGSSKMGLREMFEYTKAPFFQFASISNFPQMDRGFADHLSECLAKCSSRNIDTSAEIWKAFQESGGNAAETVSIVERALKSGSSDIESIWEERKGEILGYGGYCERKWADFTPAERLAYLMVNEERAPYDKEAIALYKKHGFSRSMMQRAYAKLMNHSFINEKDRISYQNLPLYGIWFKEQGFKVEEFDKAQ